MFFRIHGNKHFDVCKNIHKLETFTKAALEGNSFNGRDLMVKKYVIYMYDQHCPIHAQSLNDFREVQEMAATLAGFDLKDDYEFLEYIWSFKDPYVVKMITNVLRVQNNMLWTRMVTNRKVFSRPSSRTSRASTSGSSPRPSSRSAPKASRGSRYAARGTTPRPRPARSPGFTN